jgi:hypothetical protein
VKSPPITEEIPARLPKEITKREEVKMKGTKRIVVLTCILVLAFTVLFGCTKFPWDFSKHGWYIMLNVDYPAGAKTIGVSEYDVTSLHIELFYPDGQPLESVDWEAAAPWEHPYVINVDQEGEYGIAVTHISDNNGEIVEATEHDNFDIQAMIITVVNITPGVIGAIDVAEPGEDPEPEGSTLTVHLTGMGDPDPEFFTLACGLFEPGADPWDYTATILATGGEWQLVGDVIEAQMELFDVDEIWYGTDGEFYDLYIWLDMDGNLHDVPFPEEGSDLVYHTWPLPIVVQLSGPSTVVSVDFSEFVPAPPMDMP